MAGFGGAICASIDHVDHRSRRSDYWVHGAPIVQQEEDQFGNGFMQYYAQV